GEARVDGSALVGTYSEPLGDTRPEAFDEHVTSGDQPEDGRGPFLALQVDRHRLLSPTQHVAGIEFFAPADDIDHFRPQVGDHHAGVGHGTDAAKLDHAHTVQRTGHEVTRAGAV